MTGQIRRSIVLGLALAASLGVQRAPAAGTRIIAIGDVHGDYEALVRVLGRAGVIDGERHWSGGQTVLVQTGDFTDRGPRVRAVMDLLMSLQDNAPKAGGQVHVLLGNHEAMNLLGMTRDVSPQAMAEFADARSEQRRNEEYDRYVAIAAARSEKFVRPAALYRPPPREAWLARHPIGLIEYREALGPDGSYGRWLRTLPAAIQIDDTIFMHAGMDPSRAPERLEDITRNARREVSRFDDLRRALIASGWAVPAFTMEETIVAAQLARAVDEEGSWNGEGVPTNKWSLIDPEGPLWFSGLAMGEASELEKPLAKLLDRYGARRFVLGHTVMANGRIGQRFGGRVVLIDTGMLSSHFRGGRGSALEIMDGRLRAIYQDGRDN